MQEGRMNMDVANVRAVLAPKIELFEAQGKMLPAILKDFSELTQAQKEVLATVTSIANSCAY